MCHACNQLQSLPLRLTLSGPTGKAPSIWVSPPAYEIRAMKRFCQIDSAR